MPWNGKKVKGSGEMEARSGDFHKPSMFRTRVLRNQPLRQDCRGWIGIPYTGPHPFSLEGIVILHSLSTRRSLGVLFHSRLLSRDGRRWLAVTAVWMLAELAGFNSGGQWALVRWQTLPSTSREVNMPVEGILFLLKTPVLLGGTLLITFLRTKIIW